jgi:hypothetical protein
MCLVQSGLLDAVKLYGGSLISGLWFDSLSLTASYPTSGSHHRRQGMMMVVALSMLEVGKGKGVVLLPILELATNAGETMEVRERLRAPEVSPSSMNQSADPSFQTPVRIGLALACLE